MKKPVFEGLATAIVTPFKNGTIDIPTFEMLLDTQLAANVDAVVVCGTTGESATLSAQEQLALIAHAIQYTAGRCKIIAGTGSNDTAHAIDMSRARVVYGRMRRPCRHAILQQVYAIRAHRALHRHCRRRFLPRHLLQCTQPHGRRYDIGDLSGALEAPEHSGCQGSGRQPAKIAKTIETCADDFFVWSGNDDEAVGTMALGAKGLISVLSNVRPKKTLAMIRACQQNDFRCAGALQRELMELIGALFCVVNPIPVKKALELEGIPVGDPRLPLTAFPAEKLPLLKAALAKTPDA